MKKQIKAKYKVKLVLFILCCFSYCVFIFFVGIYSNNRIIADLQSKQQNKQNNFSKLIQKVEKSIVKISIKTEYNSWSGTGVFITKNNDNTIDNTMLILTAGHIVDINHIEDNVDPEYVYKVGYPIEIEFTKDVIQAIKIVDVYMEDKDITDIGLIEVEIDSNLIIPLSFEDPNNINIGEEVFAIGEPFKLFPTVTKGIISALNVDIEDDFWGEANLLQTDCPLNPGNSGCPLFNMQGKIVGICVGGYGMVNQSSGIGLCIPVDICKAVIEKYLANKYLKELANL